MALKLLRLPEVCARRGERPTSTYAAIADGRFPPPVKLTTRSSAWPEHEVDSITAAIIAGKKHDEIRELVRSLVARRATLTQPEAA